MQAKITVQIELDGLTLDTPEAAQAVVDTIQAQYANMSSIEGTTVEVHMEKTMTTSFEVEGLNTDDDLRAFGNALRESLGLPESATISVTLSRRRSRHRSLQTPTVQASITMDTTDPAAFNTAAAAEAKLNAAASGESSSNLVSDLAEALPTVVVSKPTTPTVAVTAEVIITVEAEDTAALNSAKEAVGEQAESVDQEMIAQGIEEKTGQVITVVVEEAAIVNLVPPSPPPLPPLLPPPPPPSPPVPPGSNNGVDGSDGIGGGVIAGIIVAVVVVLLVVGFVGWRIGSKKQAQKALGGYGTTSTTQHV